MKLSRRLLRRARAGRRAEDALLRESILPVAGPHGETAGMIACVGEGRGRRYFIVREGRRGFMLPVSGPYYMLGAAIHGWGDDGRAARVRVEIRACPADLLRGMRAKRYWNNPQDSPNWT